MSDPDAPERQPAAVDDGDASPVTVPAGELRALQRRALLGELGAGLAHEARNLMTPILGFAQIGRERGEDQDGLLRRLQTIERESRRVLELLERYLMASTAPRPDRETIDVGAAVRNVAALATPRARLHQIAVNAEVDVGALWIRGPRGLLEQVLLNLIGNAIDAMPGGGQATITASASATGVEVVVGDTGPGIPREVMARIFAPYFSTKARGAGVGIGLTLCRQMIEELGGTIEAANRATGTGARFTIQLPTAEPPTEVTP